MSYFCLCRCSGLRRLITFFTDTTITADAFIDFGEYWTVNSGVTLTINPGVTIIHGDVAGGIRNSGGTINNMGSIVSAIDNFGTVNNNGVIIISAFGVALNNNIGSTLHNSGTIELKGLFDNIGTFNNDAGGVLNDYGSVRNFGTINNSGVISISTDGEIQNRLFNSVINNNSDGTINNDGLIINESTINNDGIINNFLCDGTHGTIIQDGTFNGNDPTNLDFCFVVPESPVGTIAMVISLFGTLGGFVFWKRRSKSASERLNALSI